MNLDGIQAEQEISTKAACADIFGEIRIRCRKNSDVHSICLRRADSLEFAALGNGDTIEFHGFAFYNMPTTIVPPFDYIRLRRARGVYAVETINDGNVDTLHCTRLSFGVVEGTVTTGIALKNVTNPKDSVRVKCTFSLANPSIP